MARRQAEAKNQREITRCLKRYIARDVYHLLTNPPPTPHRNNLRHHRTQAQITLTYAAHHLEASTTTITSTQHPTTDLQQIGASWVGWGDNPPSSHNSNEASTTTITSLPATSNGSTPDNRLTTNRSIVGWVG